MHSILHLFFLSGFLSISLLFRAADWASQIFFNPTLYNAIHIVNMKGFVCWPRASVSSLVCILLLLLSSSSLSHAFEVASKHYVPFEAHYKYTLPVHDRRRGLVWKGNNHRLRYVLHRLVAGDPKPVTLAAIGGSVTVAALENIRWFMTACKALQDAFPSTEIRCFNRARSAQGKRGSGLLFLPTFCNAQPAFGAR